MENMLTVLLLHFVQDSFDVESKAPKAETRELVEFLEAARKAYLEILKPGETPRKKLKLVVHADRDAYLKAGGPAGSGAFYDGKKLAGYWDPDLAKACFAHELVHHLVHATSQYFFSFPEWFHEGFADALANVEVEDRVRVGAMSGAIAKMRLREIQKALKEGKAYALSDLLTMGSKRFKEGSTLTYAQSWAVSHFLLEKHRAKFLSYYKLLRAGGTNHDKAWARAFEGVKPADLEKDWKEFTLALEIEPSLGVSGPETELGIRVERAAGEFQVGDVIVQVNGKDVRTWKELREHLREGGTTVPIGITRAGRKLEIPFSKR